MIKKFLCLFKNHECWYAISHHLNIYGAENLPRYIKCKRCKNIIDMKNMKIRG